MQIDNINNSINPLKGIIEKMDNIPGQKGGDIQYNNKEYQIKYGNQQIITKKSIEKVMKEIINVLEKLKNSRKVTENLKSIFEAKENDLDNMLNQVDDSIENIIKQNLTL